MHMWGNELRVLKVYNGMILRKEIQKEEDC